MRPLRDVKYLAPGRCHASGGLYRPCALSPCGASRRTGTCGGGTPGRVRTCKPVRARELEPRACTDFATGAYSPCLLVKGTDCAGDVLPVWGVVICRSLEAGPCRSALCRVVSVGTCCPTYLPRALFSCGPRANRAGGGVASGATKLVPAFLSGLAQCRKQCPSVYP